MSETRYWWVYDALLDRLIPAKINGGSGEIHPYGNQPGLPPRETYHYLVAPIGAPHGEEGSA